MYNIGVIGNGFVGSAVVSGFSLTANVMVYDIDPKKSSHTLTELVKGADFIFVCLPTPMNKDNNNSVDLSYVENALAECILIGPKKDCVFIIKSTTVPGCMEKLAGKYKNINMVYNPEFLTERNARLDFINASRIVIGGSVDNVEKAEMLFRQRFPHTTIIRTDFVTSQFIKYIANCFFATKVGFMNEMKQAADKLGASWHEVVYGLTSDGRVGNSHLDVPGHDGKMGFGGKCFPKDINGFISLFENIGIKPTIMKAVWEKNLEVREGRDWESIKGAVSSSRT